MLVEFWKPFFTPVRLSFWGAVIGAVAGLAGSALSANAQKKAASGMKGADAAALETAEISREQWEDYKKNVSPVNEAIGKTVLNAGSPEDIARAEADAGLDVSMSFDAARKNTAEDLRSRGVGDPSSPNAIANSNALSMSEATSRVGSTRAAREYAKQSGLQKQMDYVGLNRGAPATAAAGMASASNAMSRNATNWSATAGQQAYGAGQVIGTIGKAAGDYLSKGTGTFGSAAPSWNMTDPSNLSAMAGRYGGGNVQLRNGGMVRKFAAGGEVASEQGMLEGPGTPTSDSIPAVIDGQQPAALSTDEFVLNAEATELLGDGFLNAANKIGLLRRYDAEQGGTTAMKCGGRVSGLRRRVH